MSLLNAEDILTFNKDYQNCLLICLVQPINKKTMSIEREKLEKYYMRCEHAASLKGSYMNYSKWSKMLNAISDLDIQFLPNQVRLKVIGDDNPYMVSLVDYDGNGTCTGDGVSGPIKTKHIEYIIIPFNSIIELTRMKELIDGMGKYEYEIDPEKMTLTIFGYR